MVCLEDAGGQVPKRGGLVATCCVADRRGFLGRRHSGGHPADRVTASRGDAETGRSDGDGGEVGLVERVLRAGASLAPGSLRKTLAVSSRRLAPPLGAHPAAKFPP